MITTKGALYEYMLAHPELVLQWCSGSRNDWWWLRDGGGKGYETIEVHARAAHALRDNKLIRRINGSWDSAEYVLADRVNK